MIEQLDSVTLGKAHLAYSSQLGLSALTSSLKKTESEKIKLSEKSFAHQHLLQLQEAGDIVTFCTILKKTFDKASEDLLSGKMQFIDIETFYSERKKKFKTLEKTYNDMFLVDKRDIDDLRIFCAGKELIESIIEFGHTLECYVKSSSFDEDALEYQSFFYNLIDTQSKTDALSRPLTESKFIDDLFE